MAVFSDVQFTSNVTVKALADSVAELMLSKPKGIMILCSEEAASWGDDFKQYVGTLDVPIFGGIFPGLILDSRFEPRGILVVGLRNNIRVCVIESVSTCAPVSSNMAYMSQSVNSVMILTDALSRQIDGYLQHVLAFLPEDCSVFGGGAGTLEFKAQPCLFSAAGMHQDAMILVEMSTHWDLSVGHGWEILAGPFLANSTDDNCVLELNFEPAAQLYERVVQEHSKLSFDKHEFFDIAKTFPFGLARLDDEVLIRDPLKLEGSGLVCAGDIPENTMLYIMCGDAEKLIAAASGAVNQALSTLNDTHEVTDCFLFDCVSRQLFLQDKFATELDLIHREIAPPYRTVGALVLGEIELGAGGILSLHNKTAVAALARASKQDVV
ncbi:Domain of unknown function DUF1745 [Paraglaciecola sp. T6c]|uniref:FIST signal transduction protein n=1 Tax=Pseudoalteromonas atlantica (strain T6c / ATCC BAA-1087) TaxID=3042615 RepID=UPI00005C6213|nr:FIST C-terminal domain-containing protein [Paraglaciecola sp. T6c]ABG39055.1 Domain of unknown function DUF1745 [Paraglaciecola sp. T6c]